MVDVPEKYAALVAADKITKQEACIAGGLETALNLQAIDPTKTVAAGNVDVQFSSATQAVLNLGRGHDAGTVHAYNHRGILHRSDPTDRTGSSVVGDVLAKCKPEASEQVAEVVTGGVKKVEGFFKRLLSFGN